MRHETSIRLLNEAIADEIKAIHQYMYFHFHCDDQGYDLLANMFRRTAMDEMLHTERLAERVLFLKGEVEMKPNAEVVKEHDVSKMLVMSHKMEDAAAEMYNKFANECGAANDSVTKKLFEDLVLEEEGHFDNFDNEIDNMERFGENYLTLQAIERAKTRGAGGPPTTA